MSFKPFMLLLLSIFIISMKLFSHFNSQKKIYFDIALMIALFILSFQAIKVAVANPVKS
jgi:hypothetical protein